MKYIDSHSHSPYFNLSLEEYLLKNNIINDDVIFLWRNEPTVVVGNNQNTIEEINMPYVDEHKINVVRRLSGGGAVYQDLGNLNFTFLMTFDEKDNVNIKKFTLPVVEALHNMGVPAQLSGRNDITVEGKKISGNAQRLFRNKLLHHGTLLFDTDLDVMPNVLQVSLDKIQSKGIKSVRSRVANIKEYIRQQQSVEQFRGEILKELFKDKKIDEYILTDADIKNILFLVDTKYNTWEWNFGYSPAYTIKNSRRFSGGKIEALLDVKKGIIENCQIFGDFLSVQEVSEIEDAFQNVNYELNAVKNVLAKFNLKHYFGDISLDEIITVFFG